MGKGRLNLSSLNWKKFAPTVTPSAKRLSNYRSMPERLEEDEEGGGKNPFQENTKRFICFEALRRGISNEYIVKALNLNEDEQGLLRKTYFQVRKCYFPSSD